MTELHDVQMILNDLQRTSQIMMAVFAFAAGGFFGLLLAMGNPWKK